MSAELALLTQQKMEINW